MCVLRAAFLLFLFCATFRAQGYGSISGIVVDGENRPVERAVVTLSTTGAHPQDAVAWTDEAGRFGFAYLPPGPYTLHAQKTGLGSATFGTKTRPRPTVVIHVQAGENRTDFLCRLGQSSGSISGAIIDETGEPLPYAPVRVFRQVYRRGAKTVVQIGGAATDSRGHYRISNLNAGAYFVCSEYNMNPQLAFRSDVSAKTLLQPMAQIAQCYPGSDGPQGASPIAVQPGKEVSGIDLQVALRPALQLHGRVQPPPDFDPTKNSILVEALSDSEMGGMRFGSGVNPQTLEFQFPPLTSGVFTVVATTEVNGKQYRGIQKVTLGGQSPEDIILTLQPGVNISGTAKVVGPDAGQHPLEWVGLVPGEATSMRGLNLRAAVKPDGTYRIENVPPGIWDIVAAPIPRGGYVKSMMLGEQDVLTEEMRITREAPPPLDIVVATKGGTVKGEVASDAGQPDFSVVVLAPEGKWHNVFSFYRWTQVDDLGHFELLGITPGSYKLYAFSEFDMNTEGAEGLEPFAKEGVRIDVEESKTVTQKLTLIRVQTGTQP